MKDISQMLKTQPGSSIEVVHGRGLGLRTGHTLQWKKEIHF